MRYSKVALSLLACAPIASAQDVVHTLTAPGLHNLGGALLGVDDVDQDGARDLAMVASSTHRDELRIVSGASGIVLAAIDVPRASPHDLEHAGDFDGDGLGDVVLDGAVRSLASLAILFDTGRPRAAGVGDVDGDGVPDLVTGDPQLLVHPGGDVFHFFISGNGFAELVSGAGGATLLHVDGDAWADGFGGSVRSAGDVDGDGLQDLVVSTRNLPLSNGGHYVRVYSSATGALLVDVPLAPGLSPDGAVCALGDVDGDGRGDLAIGEPSQHRTRIVSGASGATLWEDLFGALNDHYGYEVRAAGDLDLDGVLDLAASATQPPFSCGGVPCQGSSYGPGYVRLLSGRTGAELGMIVGRDIDGRFGTALASLGDLDGDGRPELAVAAPGEAAGAQSSGAVRVYSGDPLLTAPSAYCDAFPAPGESAAARIGASGSSSVASGALALTVSGASPNATGVFVFGPSRDASIALHFGAGAPHTLLCVRAPLRRVGPATRTDASGRATAALPLGGTGPFAIGTTWHFQFAGFHAGALRTSDALSLTVLP